MPHHTFWRLGTLGRPGCVVAVVLGVAVPVTAQTVRDDRAIAILVDDLNMSAADRADARATLELVRDTMLRDRDLVAVVSTGVSSVATDMSFVAGDRRMNEAIAKIGDPATPPRSGAAGIAMERSRAALALKTATDILKRLTAASDRPTVLIVLSNDPALFDPMRVRMARGLNMSPAELVPAPGVARAGGDVSEQEVVQHLAAALDLARRGRTTLLSLDTAGFRRIR